MGPCLDLTCPELELGLQCTPEHLSWDAVPEESFSALTSPSCEGSSDQVHNAQICTISSVLDTLQTECHIIQQLAPFSRVGAFAIALDGSLAVIGGSHSARLSVRSSSLRQPDDESTLDFEAVGLQNLEVSTGAAVKKRKLEGKADDSCKKIRLKSDEQWLWEQARESDESSIARICRSQACRNHVVISDVRERIRSGRPQMESVAATQVFHKARDTSALLDGMLIIYSCHTSSLTLFELRTRGVPASCDEYLAWDTCAMPASPADATAPMLHSVCDTSKRTLKSNESDPRRQEQSIRPSSHDTQQVQRTPPGLSKSRQWRQSDFEQGARELEQAGLHWNTCMVSGERGLQLPSSSSCWCTMASDAARGRFVILQGGQSCRHWQLFEFVPKKPMESSPDLPLAQACQRNYRFLARQVQGCSGRMISVKYSAQYAVVHEAVLFAFVCPDASTSAAQRPQSMRVYTLHLGSLVWSLCPCKANRHELKFPMPRTQAAYTHNEFKVYMHGGSPVTTGHGCLKDLWQFDLRTHLWTEVSVVAPRHHVSSKLATSCSTAASVCQHTLVVDSSGSFIVHGGSTSRGETNRNLQVFVKLVKNVPGGAPTDMAMASRIRPAGLVAALSMCRARIARAVLPVNKVSAMICIRKGQSEQRISAPILVLQLYSEMLYNMVQDGVFDASLSDPESSPAMLPVNPQHEPDAVQMAMRWVMGLCTMLPLDVYLCSEVLRVAEFFMMRSLRAEALCVICQKALAEHLPVLEDLHATFNIPELQAVICRLQHGRQDVQGS